MPAVASVELSVLDEWGYERGFLTIAALPSQRSERAIVVVDEGDEAFDDFERVRLIEGTEYVYVLEMPEHAGPFETDHPEMFIADTERGHRGRLRTGLFTGAVEVQFFSASRRIGKTSFEVASTKLSYVRDYHWMLRDIAEICTELTMDRFAPAAGRFSVHDERDAETLYQRCAFVQSVLEGDEFRAAVGHILASPHVTWEDVEDVTWSARAMRPSSRIAQSLARPGPRSMTPEFYAPDLDSIPRRMILMRAATSVDNVPNRFVKWMLQEWLVLFGRVAATLDQYDGTRGATRRGRREVARALTTIEAILEDDLFQGVGELNVFPEANQVLQKREGYRYLFRMHLQFEAAARLYWPGLDPVYRAGQRNVAKLYEYWVYLQMGRIVARLCGQTFDAARLIEKNPEGLTLRLRTREESMVRGTIERFGREMRIEAWFNKSFGASSEGPEGSWTRPLRPDCSLRVEVVTNRLAPLVTWIHFDAKYRLERLEETFGLDDEPDEWKNTRFRRDDLLKMHAYKDALRQSAGAYIVYPGAEEGKPFRQYHELLPGLGAFALRPALAGESRGSDTLTVFIENALEHLALQATQHARARYWTERAYADKPIEAVAYTLPFLDRPPADVLVLLGYAKSAAHRAWIKRALLYNLRADPHRGGAVGINGREVATQFLVVFGSDQPDVEMYEIIDAPRIMTARHLESLQYPEAGGNYYLCLSLRYLPSPETSKWLVSRLVQDVRARKNPAAPMGAPVVVTWLDLCAVMNVAHSNE